MCVSIREPVEISCSDRCLFWSGWWWFDNVGKRSCIFNVVHFTASKWLFRKQARFSICIESNPVQAAWPLQTASVVLSDTQVFVWIKRNTAGQVRGVVTAQ